MRHDTRVQHRAMFGTILLLMVTVAGALNIPVAAAQVGPTTPPARVFGNVSVAGRPAPGATVIALVGSTACGVTTTAADGSYQVDVRSAATQAGCGIDGAVVTFTVDGRTAPDSVIYQAGGFIRRDLHLGEPVAEVLVERWARYSDEPCANPVEFWCVRAFALPPAREPYASYRMLVTLRDGRTEQVTDWITVEPNAATASVSSRHERGVDRVRWERWTLVGSVPCNGRIEDFWCIESVEVAPPITGTIWYRLLVRHPDGRTEDPTGIIPASP
ncbi:MAG: hypothetical protein AB7U18_24345 [Dehalococcoidia bacterium]